MKLAIYGYHHAHIDMFIDEAEALGHSLVAVCDPGNPMATAMAARKNVPTVDVAELIALNPDIICSSAINNEKIDIIEFCHTHGFNLMLDKPAVTTEADYQRLQEIMAEGKIQIGMMLTERFSPEIQTLRRLIQEGVLGDLRHISFNKPHKLRPETRDSWHFSQEQNGGIVIDLLCHDLDLLLWLSESHVVDIKGYVTVGGNKDYPDFTDSTALVTQTESGVLCQMMANWWEPEAYPVYGRGRIICTGTEGTVEIMTTGEPLFDLDPYLYLCTHKTEPTKMFADKPESTLAEDFISRIEGNNEAPMIGHDEILTVSKLCLNASDAVDTVSSD